VTIPNGESDVPKQVIEAADLPPLPGGEKNISVAHPCHILRGYGDLVGDLCPIIDPNIRGKQVARVLPNQWLMVEFVFGQDAPQSPAKASGSLSVAGAIIGPKRLERGHHGAASLIGPQSTTQRQVARYGRHNEKSDEAR
jgi:hypothetical protein